MKKKCMKCGGNEMDRLRHFRMDEAKYKCLSCGKVLIENTRFRKNTKEIILNKKAQKKKDREKRSKEKVLKRRKALYKTSKEVRDLDRLNYQTRRVVKPIRNDSLTKEEMDTLLDNLAVLQDAETTFLKDEQERKEKHQQLEKMKAEGKTPEEIKKWLDQQNKHSTVINGLSGFSII
jgi:hypothetical protein